ncbi:hypothetical protein X824_gp054 [Escherichia phage 4MG]|uniref:Hyphothetical protein n=1 Tax=Escherichia phage 4MG TaxID=1391428 RepID=V5KSU4_9CAUD|nr:hypothetical protein X824_gp054 [Escherichia phage 4MG]AGZ17528.1 hyphothetical protein [Escherichia phage 4MG]
MAFVSNNQSKPQQGKATANVEKKVNTAQEASGEVQYTLFASGLNYGGRNVELKDKNYTNDLAIIFDVVEQHSYTRTVDKTSYAVEEKVKFSDHGVIEDGKFSFSARVNSSPVYLIENNYLDKDTDDQNPVASRRPEKALEILERLITDRQIVTLVTEDKIIENYILTSMEAARSNSDGAALVFQLEFTEFRTFTLGKTALATVYSDPKKSGGKTKQKGSQQSSATDNEVEVTARRTKFAGPNKDGWQKIAEAMDSGNFTKQDQVIGTITPDGKIRGTDGSIMDYKKAVGN